MTSQHSIFSNAEQRVIFLLLDSVELLDLAGPAQVFSIAASLGASYSLHFCANHSGVKSAQGLFLGQLEPLPTVSANDVVMVAGIALDKLNQPLLDPDTRCWLVHAHTNGTQIASICTGAAVLGEAGLLDGRRCTTHWFVVEDLQQRYPITSQTKTSNSRIYLAIRSGSVLHSWIYLSQLERYAQWQPVR